MNNKSVIIDSLKSSISENIFVKLTLSDYLGIDDGLKNVYAKRIMIKNEEKISFTYRYKTKDIVKNYSLDEALELFDKMTLASETF